MWVGFWKMGSGDGFGCLTGSLDPFTPPLQSGFEPESDKGAT